MKNSKEDIFISSNTISKKILNDKEESLFSLRIPYSKTMNFTSTHKNKQNIINIFGDEFVNINDDFGMKPKDAIFEDVCSMCSSKIYYKKYICVICPNCILCEKCQEEHLHPIIKSKYSQFSNAMDIYNFLKNYNDDLKNDIRIYFRGLFNFCYYILYNS